MRYLSSLRVAAWALLSAGLIVAWPVSAPAAAPANDTCQGAIIVPAAGPFPYLTPLVTNINEATSAGDPAIPGNCGSVVLRSGGIWYTFTPTVGGTYHFSVSDDTDTTVVDTLMAVYRGSGGCAGSSVDCNDDQGSLTSALEVSLTANNPYVILVWAAWITPTPSTSTIQLRVGRPTIPANDTCAGAEIVPATGPFPYLTQIADTTLATSTGDPPAPNCTTNHFAGSVWYRFTPANSGTYVVSTHADTRTSVYDTLLAIYTGSCGTFTQVACSDFYDRRAVITNAFTGGTTYYIVAGDATEEGVIPGETLIQLRVFEPRPPEVKIATSVSPTSAVLNATIPNFNTARINTWFEWGPTTSYGSNTPVQSLKTGTNDVNISALLTALSPTAYHYRLVVSNCFGFSRSTDQPFLWSNSRPMLSSFNDPTGFRLQFTGNPGQRYTVLSSGSLSGWQEAGPPTDLGNGTFEYRDPSPGASERFFRVRSP